MISEVDPSARMQVRARGQLMPPASCYVCGSGSCDYGYVDFGTFVDYHGSFYLCMTCAVEMAEAIGFLSPEDLKLKDAAVETRLNEALELEKENAELRATIDHLNGVLGSKYLGSNPDGEVKSEPVNKGSAKKRSGPHTTKPKPSEPTPFT